MKKTLIFLWVFSTFFVTQAQNDVFFSQYMLNAPSYNPAALGEATVSNVSFHHRSQWLGYNSTFDGDGGSPQTQLLTVTVPMEGIISGLGAQVVNDNLGPVNNLQVRFPVSYSRPLGRGRMSLGLVAGFFSQTLKFDELRFNDPDDPLNVGRRESQMRPNLGLGLHFQTASNLSVGLGAQNIIEPSFDFSRSDLDNDVVRTYYGSVGFNKVLTRSLYLAPSLLIRSDLETFTFDLGAVLSYQQLAWAGASFRRGEALVFLLGYSFLDSKALKVGYSLDYVVDEQQAKQPTSHEFYIRYDLPNFVFGGKKQVKTPRYTY